jgi:acyl-coenzyme A synthetase/AMP-(fatty) acid ligase
MTMVRILSQDILFVLILCLFLGNLLPAGVEGNLVLTRPIPNQPLYFWNDPGDRRYLSTYYETFPGKEAWNQGDWYVRDTTSGLGLLTY